MKQYSIEELMGILAFMYEIYDEEEIAIKMSQALGPSFFSSESEAGALFMTLACIFPTASLKAVKERGNESFEFLKRMRCYKKDWLEAMNLSTEHLYNCITLLTNKIVELPNGLKEDIFWRTLEADQKGYIAKHCHKNNPAFCAMLIATQRTTPPTQRPTPSPTSSTVYTITLRPSP